MSASISRGPSRARYTQSQGSRPTGEGEDLPITDDLLPWTVTPPATFGGTSPISLTWTLDGLRVGIKPLTTQLFDINPNGSRQIAAFPISSLVLDPRLLPVQVFVLFSDEPPKSSSRTALSTQAATVSSTGVVFTVTPIARPFCAAAQTCAAMLAGTAQLLRYVPLFSTWAFAPAARSGGVVFSKPSM